MGLERDQVVPGFYWVEINPVVAAGAPKAKPYRDVVEVVPHHKHGYPCIEDCRYTEGALTIEEFEIDNGVRWLRRIPEPEDEGQ